MSDEYSHRNGETEPPTIEGVYWLDGQKNGAPYRDIVFGYYDGTENSRATDSAAGYIFEGRWWGPIVPPWGKEKTNE